MVCIVPLHYLGAVSLHVSLFFAALHAPACERRGGVKRSGAQQEAARRGRVCAWFVYCCSATISRSNLNKCLVKKSGSNRIERAGGGESKQSGVGFRIKKTHQKRRKFCGASDLPIMFCFDSSLSRLKTGI
jgi:hypothetical protein